MTHTGLFNFLTQQATLLALLRACLYIIIGFLLARLTSRGFVHLYEKRPRPIYTLLLSKIIFYFIFTLFVISAIHELGFDLHILLGATGILTVALGFASQTSASNFISGLFLLGERTFHLGDVITINGATGEVFSIDLFSVKLKQADNTLVRIPNEMILKTPVINLSRFPQRRFECVFNASATVPLKKLREIILPVLAAEPVALSDPAPSLEIKDINDNSIKYQLLVWSNQKDFSHMKSRVYEILVTSLLANDINIADSTMNIRIIPKEKSE